MIRKSIVLISFISSALLSSQAPEFAQQYRQRLGGAVDELKIIVADFDNDAKKLGLSRQQALQQLNAAKEAFFNARGARMQKTINRYSDLSAQLSTYDSLNPAMRPVALFTAFDEQLLHGTWQNYQAAVPVNLFAAIWTVLGGLFGWLLIRALLLLFPSSNRSKRNTKRNPKTPPTL